ncbi:MAG TPA: hypothetical protein VNP98_07055 [Chthoniobacterales bacterium]|nr:hypothetical protein [Chthoniobacterales bacterium]
MDLTQPASLTGAAAPPREQGRVTANIGTLVLRGFPPMMPARVEAAFSVELSRLLRTAPARQHAWSGRHSDELPPLRLRFHTQPTARTVGRELARAIFREIAGREESQP